MWIPRAARDPRSARGCLTPAAPSPRPGRADALPWRRVAAFSCVLVLWQPPNAIAQPAASTASRSAPEELIATVRSNGVARGEFTLLRQPDGDYWVRGADLPRLQLEPLPGARRTADNETYYSFRALGASGLAFNEAELALELAFPGDRLEGTRIDLASPPGPAVITEPRTSLIMSYRLAASRGTGQSTQLHLDTDFNVRVAGILLRQAAHFSPSGQQQGSSRGVSQLIWDR